MCWAECFDFMIAICMLRFLCLDVSMCLSLNLMCFETRFHDICRGYTGGVTAEHVAGEVVLAENIGERSSCWSQRQGLVLLVPVVAGRRVRACLR